MFLNVYVDILLEIQEICSSLQYKEYGECIKCLCRKLEFDLNMCPPQNETSVLQTVVFSCLN